MIFAVIVVWEGNRRVEFHPINYLSLDNLLPRPYFDESVKAVSSYGPYLLPIVAGVVPAHDPPPLSKYSILIPTITLNFISDGRMIDIPFRKNGHPSLSSLLPPKSRKGDRERERGS